MKNTVVQEESGLSILSIIKSVLIAFIITFLLFAVMAFILLNVEFPEMLLPSFVIVSIVISVLFSSMMMTRIHKQKGLINGVLVGLGYTLVMYLIGSGITENFGLSKDSIFIVLSAIIAGGIGGIIGVNIKR